VSGRAELFLAIIAVATLLIAVIQVGVLVAAGLLARRITRLVEKIERDLAPVFGHLDAIGREATRAATLATRQVERVDQLFADVAGRLEHTMNDVQKAVQAPVGQATALLMGVRAAMTALRELRPARARRRADDEDALFI
jgi:hypothetical protein